MNVRKFLSISILALFLGTTACNMPADEPATQDPYEAAALTVTALAGTEQAGPPSPTATVTLTPTPINTSTSAPPPATAAIASSTPSGTVFVVDVGANCRSGPGINYDRTGSFAPGTYLTLTGRNADSTWWYVQTGSSNCWISATTGHTSGSVANVPVVAAPPSPTVTSTAVTAYP